MDQIKDRLNKINPSIWQCNLRSEDHSKEETKNQRPDVHTSCHISLEAPSDFVIKSPDGKKNENNTSQVINI